MGRISWVLLGLVIASCAAFKSIHYGEEYSPPTQIEKVEVFFHKPEQDVSPEPSGVRIIINEKYA